MYNVFVFDIIRSLFINNGFFSCIIGVIIIWCVVVWVRGVVWVWYVLCSIVLWVVLRIIWEMIRFWICYVGSSISYCSGCWSNILYYVSVIVIIIIWEIVVVVCIRVWWEFLWCEVCRGVVFVFVGVKGVVGYIVICGVVDVWFGVWLCVYFYILFLYWFFRF